MENPREEIQDVVRSITEPQDAETVLRNIDKYFTEDAFLEHPVVIQAQFARGKDNLKALYYIFRKGTHDNKIHFHAVMFNEDLTQCTLELTEDVKTGFVIPGPLDYVRFLVRVDLRLEPDGKYRIWRQHDVLIGDMMMPGLRILPGAGFMAHFIKCFSALCGITLGRYFARDLLAAQKKTA